MTISAAFSLQTIVENHENELNNEVPVHLNVENVENNEITVSENSLNQIAYEIIDELGPKFKEEIEQLRKGNDFKALAQKIGCWIHKQVVELKNDPNVTWESVNGLNLNHDFFVISS